jgi:hypothetical protein
LRRRSCSAAILLIAGTASAAPGWEVRIPDRVEVAQGASAQLAIAIAVDRGLTVSKDAPVIIDLVPEAGAVVKKRRLGRPEAVDPGADAPRFTVVVKGEAAGDHALAIRVRFWLCAAKTCRPIDVKKTAQVAVTTTTPPPP